MSKNKTMLIIVAALVLLGAFAMFTQNKPKEQPITINELYQAKTIVITELCSDESREMTAENGGVEHLLEDLDLKQAQPAENVELKADAEYTLLFDGKTKLTVYGEAERSYFQLGDDYYYIDINLAGRLGGYFAKALKPVIYLYPEKETTVDVKLELNGKLSTTYPTYNNGWKVKAYPDGKLINLFDNREYSYLYWEANLGSNYDLSKGFVVKGEDTAEFLQNKLAEIGLLPKEYNEFIVFWLPKMEHNAYNLISFQTTAYTDNAKLILNPQPDSALRVFMVYKPLSEAIDIEAQEFEAFERKGFSLVEWGGSELE